MQWPEEVAVDDAAGAFTVEVAPPPVDSPRCGAWSGAAGGEADASGRQGGRGEGREGHPGRWKAVVAFTLDRTGQVLETHIAKRSGIPVLDEEAMALIRRVRFPPPPGDRLSFTLPITFGVR